MPAHEQHQQPHTTHSPVATYGAVDLSHLAVKTSPKNTDGVRHVVIELDATQWQDISVLSSKVPVVIEFYDNSDDSASVSAVLRTQVESLDGRVLLARVDTQGQPQLAQAFQVASAPIVFAVLNGRPLPLFQGAVTAQQVSQVLDQLLAACAQAGVTGTIDPQPATDSEGNPEPPAEYASAVAAREAGDVDGEVAAWKKVLANHPADSVAAQNLAEAQIRARLAHADRDSDDPLMRADIAFARGDVEESFALLLDVVAHDDERKDDARQQLLDGFKVVGATDERVKRARARLANLLF